MNRRQMLQYLASIASAPAAIGAFSGCAAGGPPARTDRPASGAAVNTAQPDDTHKASLVPRRTRAQHLYICSEMAPGVDIREHGFEHAVILYSSRFVDRNGMASEPRMRTLLNKKLREVGDPNFRGPFILNMEGGKYAGGLRSSHGETYEAAARRMNSAILAVRRIVPNALVSCYGSPFVNKGRMDYSVAQRAVQRLHGQTFLNPSLYDGLKGEDHHKWESDIKIRREYVAWSRKMADRLGIDYVFPMLHFRYRGAAQVDKPYGLEVIPREEFVNTQVLASRDGGAHGLVIWHADLYRKRVADDPEIDIPAEQRAVIDRVFGGVTMAELARIHRNVLDWTREAFLTDPQDADGETPGDGPAPKSAPDGDA